MTTSDNVISIDENQWQPVTGVDDNMQPVTGIDTTSDNLSLESTGIGDN